MIGENILTLIDLPYHQIQFVEPPKFGVETPKPGNTQLQP